MSIDIRQAVLADIETKINAGENLKAVIGRHEAAAQALADADAAVVDARKAALASGWSESELKRLKLLPTTRSARTRSGRASRARAASDERALPSHSDVGSLVEMSRSDVGE